MGRRLNAPVDVPEADSTPGANVTEVNLVEISNVALERAGCRWFCTGSNGCRWVCAGGRRLSMADDVPEAGRNVPGANATELNIVDISSVELERAGCRWFCTGRNGCRWICSGGRRLNTAGDEKSMATLTDDRAKASIRSAMF